MFFTIDQDHLRRFSRSERERIMRAVYFVNHAHRNQRRQEGVPYVTHLVCVAEIVCGWGCDAETVMAALLHDVVEDTEGRLEQIETHFGTNVAMLVDGATKVDHPERVVADKLTQDKISAFYERDKRIAYVKLADRIHNLSTISYLEQHRQERIVAESQTYYVSLALKLGDEVVISDLSSSLQGLNLKAKS